MKLLLGLIVALIIGVATPKASAQGLPFLNAEANDVASPLKYLEEQEKKRVEEEKKKEAERVEQERIAHLKATQPWVFRPNGGPNRFSYGYCTWHVKNLRPDINWRGNANAWDERTSFPVSNIPLVGAIGVTKRYMHVVYILEVRGDTVLVSEMNFKGWNRINTRVAPVTEFRYIL